MPQLKSQLMISPLHLTQKEKLCSKVNVTKVPLTSFKLHNCRVLIHTNDEAED